MTRETAMEGTAIAEVLHRCEPGRCHRYNFSWIGVVWCVTYALELLAQDPSLGQPFIGEITGLDGSIGFPPDPDRNTVGLFAVDVEHAATVDLSKPPLVVRLVSAKGEGLGTQIIDGWHRVYKARTQGLTELPMIMLPPEVELAIRVVDNGGLLRRG
jgi:hypothetical protein